MRRLGAILAGGESRRFGGDKAAALLDGRQLIAHVADGLRPQVDALIVAGRNWPGLNSVDDMPGPGNGPLGGLCGALGFGSANGYAAVVSHPCDLLPVADWAGQGDDEPVYAAGHYAAGIWPCRLYARLAAFLDTSPKLSMRAWIECCGARAVECGPMADLNTRAALRLYRAGRPPVA